MRPWHVALLVFLSEPHYVWGACKLRSSPPKLAKCNQRSNPPAQFFQPVNELQRVASFADCRDLCMRRINSGIDNTPPSASLSYGCSGFEYDHETGTCFTYIGGTLYYPNRPQENQSSSLRYYAQQCFDCSYIKCPLPLTGNLLDNGDFESSKLLGPWDVNGASVERFVGTDGYNSTRSFQLRVGHKTSSKTGVTLTQDFNQCPGFYSISFVYKVIPHGPQTTPSFKFSFGRMTYTLVPPITRLAEYQTFDTIVRSPGVGNYLIYPSSVPISFFMKSSHGPTTYYIDNVRAYPIKAGGTKGPELIQNGGFENGIEPWSISIENVMYIPANYSLYSPGLGGSDTALLFTHTFHKSGYYDTTPNNVFNVDQNVTTTPGTIYILSFDYRYNYTSFESQICEGYFVTVLLGDYTSPDPYYTLDGRALPGNYISDNEPTYTYSQPFKAMSEITPMRVQLRPTYGEYEPCGYCNAGDNNSCGETYFTVDNFSLKELHIR